MNSIPNECQIYVLITAIFGVLFFAALIRVWLLRRTESKLLKNKEALEQQILQQQKDLMSVRQDSNAWRAEMQRQFDLFRHMASDQLLVEEKRFDDLLTKSREREQHLQTTLDITKQMCVELPGTKARLMQLESIIGLDGGEHLSPASTSVKPEPAFHLGTVPDLNGGSTATSVEEPPQQPAQATAESPAVPQDDVTLQKELSHLQLQNLQLQQALAAARLRSRVRDRQTKRSQIGKK